MNPTCPAGVAYSPPENLPPGTWRCLVCQKPTIEIHVLPCQHKFCTACLELWAGIYIDMYHGVDSQFPCQICWKLYDVPHEGMGAYVQDFQVNSLENCLQQMTFGQQESQSQGQPGSGGQGYFGLNNQGHGGLGNQGQGHFGFGGQGPCGVGVQGQGHQFGSQGAWDAGATAESVFSQHTNHGDISSAKMEHGHREIPSEIPKLQDINCDDEPTMLTDVSSPNEAQGGSTSGLPMRGNALGISPGGVVSPSMVSHMAPNPIMPTQASNYCLRSRHLYMHMI